MPGPAESSGSDKAAVFVELYVVLPGFKQQISLTKHKTRDKIRQILFTHPEDNVTALTECTFPRGVLCCWYFDEF
jgi:hypothetical protein